MSSWCWRLLNNSSLSKPKYYYFTQKFELENIQGVFAILSEELIVSSDIKSSVSKSDIGASLAVKAAKKAFAELEKKQLDFESVFFDLFGKYWQAIVLLHAIENSSDNSTFPITNSKDEEQINASQKNILEQYDPSLVLLYQFDQKLMFLQVGYTQIALLNQKHNCEIKQSSERSFSDFLLHLENNKESESQLTEIKDDQVGMVVLLSQHYTHSKTPTRLNANMIKLCRQLDADKELTDIDDDLIVLKKEAARKEDFRSIDAKEGLINPKIKASSPSDKKSFAPLFLLLAFVFSTSFGFYFWQEQATRKKDSEIELTKESNPAIVNNNLIALEQNKEPIQSKLEVKEDIKEQKAEKEPSQQQDNFIKAEKKSSQQQDNFIKVKKEKTIKKGVNDPLRNEEKRSKGRLAMKNKPAKKEKKLESEKETIALAANKIDPAPVKEDKKLPSDNEPVVKKEQQAQQEQKNPQEEIVKITPEKMTEKKRLEALVKQRRAEFARDQKLKKQQQIAKQEREKLAEEKRLEALVKQRREEFERDKKLKNKLQLATSSANNIIPKNRQQQRQVKEDRKQHESRKRRNISDELEKQQQKQMKVKESRQRMLQQTATHQLVAYSKRFEQHTQRLKKKREAIRLLEQKKNAANDPVIIHQHDLLEAKEVVIRKSLDSIAKQYLNKLREICSKEKVYSMASSRSNSATERAARLLITQQLKSCSQSKLLSSQSLTKTLLGQYLK